MGPPVLLACMLLAAPRSYELAGRLVPETRAFVVLHGATTPFTASAATDMKGRFSFRKLEPGTYTLSVFVRRRGEARRTIEIGPSLADEKSKVTVTFDLAGASFVRRQRWLVSARELSISDKAKREYVKAQEKLARRDVDAALAHLQRAVEISPQFSAAWNNLGTIAYQTKKFDLAEERFRTALEHDPNAFEPLVNLGGVLLTRGKLDEAIDYNVRAVLLRPEDALANSQLGMSYFAAGNLGLAQKYLEIARRLDPAHFSHPQLLLAELHLRRKEPAAAAEAMEDFLNRHPDWPEAPRMRQAIAQLRK